MAELRFTSQNVRQSRISEMILFLMDTISRGTMLVSAEINAIAN